MWLTGIPRLHLESVGHAGQREAMHRQVRVRQPLLKDVPQAFGKGGDFVVLKIRLVVDVVQSRFSLISVGA